MSSERRREVVMGGISKISINFFGVTEYGGLYCSRTNGSGRVGNVTEVRHTYIDFILLRIYINGFTEIVS